MIAHHFFVCTNQKSGVGEEVARALKKELKHAGLKSVRGPDGRKRHNRVQTCNCLDLCKQCKKGPGAAVVVYPEGVYYGHVRPKDAPQLVEEHAGAGRAVTALRIEPKP